MKRDIHTFFNLSYSSYLILQRSTLQSMPKEWQYKFVELLEELVGAGYSELMPKEKGSFVVKLRDSNGKFIKDPLANYNRGSRDLNRELEEYRKRQSN